MISLITDKNTNHRKIYTELLMDITHTMLNSTEEDDFFKLVLAGIGQIMNVSRVYIFDYTDGLWNNLYEWTADGVAAEQENLQSVSMEDMSINSMLHVLLRGEIYEVADVSKIEDKETRDVLLTQGIQAVLASPLYFEGRIWGMFGFDICDKNLHWPEESIDIIIAIANLLSSAKGHFHIKRKLELKNKQLEVILDAFPDPIYIADMNTYDVLFANKSIQNTVPNYTEKKFKCYQAFQEQDEPCSFCTNNQLTLDAPPIVWTHTNTFLQKEYRVIDTCIEWEKNYLARLSIAMDMTDTLKAKQEEVLAKEANKAKSNFLANMSHELRTPLNGIIGLNHLALQATTDPSQIMYLNKMKSSAHSLLSIINNILDFSKIDADKIEIESIPFDLRETVQSVFDTVEVLAANKHLKFSVIVDNKIPQVLIGDPLRVTQVLLNLISNAIKFTCAGSVTLSCDFLEDKDGKNIVGLRVKDTGIGMSEEQIDKLFIAFNQADNSTTRKFGGTGLGLTISKRLVELMGGKIYLNSTPNIGSTFTFYIPFDFANQEDINNLTHKNIPIVNPVEISLQNVKVLLVEDNDINQMITRELLEIEGCIVDIANNGIEAIEQTHKHSYDLILMDIQMPVMDGLEAAQKIRENHDYDLIPIIAMTAHARSIDRENSLAAGMQDHLIKPINPENFREVLCKWLPQRTVLQ